MGRNGLAALCVAAMVSMTFSPGAAGERGGGVYRDFAGEEIKPYVKIMEGPWADNALDGVKGDYRITVKIPKGAKYVLGLFDAKVGRTGADERSAVVLVDGVNPLAPSEKAAPAEIGKRDVSAFRKVPLDGITFSARDSENRDFYVKVVDAKEDGVPGPIRPFTIPPGKRTGHVDVLVFAGPAHPPTPGQKMTYGKPLARFAILLEEEPR